MSKTAMNDMRYNFEPLKLFQPNMDYKVDERELQKSIAKSKELIARIRGRKNNGTTQSQDSEIQ